MRTAACWPYLGEGVLPSGGLTSDWGGGGSCLPAHSTVGVSSFDKEKLQGDCDLKSCILLDRIWCLSKSNLDYVQCNTNLQTINIC